MRRERRSTPLDDSQSDELASSARETAAAPSFAVDDEKREVVMRYPHALAAYADLHASLGNLAEARSDLERTLARHSSPPERALLGLELAALERRGAGA